MLPRLPPSERYGQEGGRRKNTTSPSILTQSRYMFPTSFMAGSVLPLRSAQRPATSERASERTPVRAKRRSVQIRIPCLSLRPIERPTYIGTKGSSGPFNLTWRHRFLMEETAATATITEESVLISGALSDRTQILIRMALTSEFALPGNFYLI